MKRVIVLTLVLAMSVCTVACGTTSKSDVKLDPNNPVLITVWNYYNGMQLQTFDEMIEAFNNTIGAEEGIVVEAHSCGSVGDLTSSVLAAANEEVGAEELPDIFAAYGDTAYEIDKKGLLADLNNYLSEDDQDLYMDAYMEEGHLDGGEKLTLFPAAKSTETLMLNETAWKEFADETGADKSKLATWEGIVDIAEQYYNWTDAKTQI